MNEPILTTRGLCATAGEDLLLEGIDVELSPGAVLAVVGQSGSGKTTLGLALNGESRPGVTLAGSVRLHGTELLGSTDAQRRCSRAGTASVLPQHPAEVLNPIRRIGAVLRELAALRHSGRTARDAAVRESLVLAQLDPTPGLLRRFPHQLSGGQQQRVAFAQALITNPDIVVLDEPTTGADTVTKSDTADMLTTLAANGTALVLLTHDLPLARRLADEVLVLRNGHTVEHGPSTEPLHAPVHQHTRDLLAAEPALATQPDDDTRRSPVLRAVGIGHRANDGTELLHAVDLTVNSGQCAAIVGPSGAGKTTLARCLAGLSRPHTGRVLLDDVALAPTARRRPREDRRRVQYIHQDARAAFDPSRPVARQVARTAELLRGIARKQAMAEAEDMLNDLGMDPREVRRRPTALSGGQLQRAALARALLARPTMLICDEITASLDTLNQSELFRALKTAQSMMDLSILLISHDFAAVSALADEVHLLHEGRLVESATPQGLLTNPSSEVAVTLVGAARKHHRTKEPSSGG